DHDVVGGDHAEVAMARFGGMDEERGRARTGERRRDLARNVAGFADAGHHDAPTARLDDADRLDEALVQPRRECLHRLRLRGQHFSGEREQRLGGGMLAWLVCGNHAGPTKKKRDGETYLKTASPATT